MYQYVKRAFFSHLEDVLALDEVDADPVLGEDVPLLVDAHQHRLRRLQRDQLREGVRCLGLKKQEGEMRAGGETRDPRQTYSISFRFPRGHSNKSRGGSCILKLF